MWGYIPEACTLAPNPDGSFYYRPQISKAELDALDW